MRPNAVTTQRPVLVPVSRRLGPGVIRLHRSWPGLQPEALLAWLDRSPAEQAVAWSDPRARLLVVGVGECVGRSWTAGDPFRLAQAFCERLVTRTREPWDDATPAGVPLTWLRFQGEAEGDWPQGWVHVPQQLAYWLDGASGLVAHASLVGPTPADQVQNELDDELDRLTLALDGDRALTQPHARALADRVQAATSAFVHPGVAGGWGAPASAPATGLVDAVRARLEEQSQPKVVGWACSLGEGLTAVVED